VTVETSHGPLEWLREAAAAGEVHTVRVSWVDRLGTWRGKRLPVDVFLGSPQRRIGFCDGMIVVDVNCDVIQETPFSNFETGYPDMYLRPRLESLRQVGWSEGEAFVFGSLESHGGEPLAVSPANVLARVLGRLGESGIAVAARLTVCGRLQRAPGEPVALLPDGRGRDEEPPGVLRQAAEGLRRSGVALRSLEAQPDGAFRLALGPSPAAAAAEQAVLAKAALKEVTRPRGLHAVFMTRLPGVEAASELGIELELAGCGGLDTGALWQRLTPLRSLLQPSVNAFKAGPPRRPSGALGEDGLTLRGLAAASEADAATALAALGAAVGATLEGADGGERAQPEGLAGAATLLDECGWARDWLGEQFVDNAVPLLRHEAAGFAAAVTDWELDRYWSAG
jgi:glutamine synthetase